MKFKTIFKYDLLCGCNDWMIKAYNTKRRYQSSRFKRGGKISHTEDRTPRALKNC